MPCATVVSWIFCAAGAACARKSEEIMEKESVLFKGLKTGLLLVLVGKPEFSAVEREIRRKLETSALFFRRGTVIGGQEVQSQGSVLVLGNVNPGAQVIAGGSIDIRGTCRGIVHAGAYGDRSAIIIADRLMPVQIRIADVIAQSPEQYEKPELAERASVQDGRIVVEPIER